MRPGRWYLVAGFVALAAAAGWFLADGAWTATVPVRKDEPVGRDEAQRPARPAPRPIQGFKGRVVDPAGAPVAGARVLLMKAPGFREFMSKWGSQPLATARSGRDGRFALQVELPGGEPGGEPGKEPVEQPGEQPGEFERTEVHLLCSGFAPRRLRTLYIVPGDVFDLGDVALRVGQSIRGRVIDEAGAAVAGALVYARMQSRSYATPVDYDCESFVLTGADGRYELRHLDEAVEYRITALARRYARAHRSEVSVPTEDPVDLTLEYGREIVGTVVDPDGVPVPGAEVEWRPLRMRDEPDEPTRTDAEGRFRFANLRIAHHTLSIEAPGHGWTSEMVLSSHRRPIIRLERPEFVDVIVADEQGRPVTDYTVRPCLLFEKRVSYVGELVEVAGAGNGTGRIGCRNFDELVFEVRAKGFAKEYSAPVAVRAKTAPCVRVTLHRGGSITGVVTDAAGRAVAGAVVRILPNGFRESSLTRFFPPQYPQPIRAVECDSAGRFRMDRVRPGAHQIQVDHPEHVRAVRLDVAVAKGEVANLGQVRLARGCQIEGVVHFEGAPRGQIVVSLSHAGDGPYIPNVVTDSRGRFRIGRRVAPGAYTIAAARFFEATPAETMRQYRVSRQQLEIRAGQETCAVRIDVR